MNAKKVLSKIAEYLSSQEVKLTYAKLKDGTVVESATFDVGEDLFVIGEDGTKTPAPNGEHELSLRDEEGNEVLIKVISEDGKIVERENVELADADAETIEAEPIPQADGAEPVEMAEETDIVEDNLPTTGDGVPADIEKEGPEIEISLGEIVEKLQYRIDEMEKKIASFEAVNEEVVDKEADIEEEMEEELPKLDGAPVESPNKFSANKTNFGKKVMSAQESVLAKLYK
jgi:hypothetical protein